MDKQLSTDITISHRGGKWLKDAFVVNFVLFVSLHPGTELSHLILQRDTLGISMNFRIAICVMIASHNDADSIIGAMCTMPS